MFNIRFRTRFGSRSNCSIYFHGQLLLTLGADASLVFVTHSASVKLVAMYFTVSSAPGPKRSSCDSGLHFMVIFECPELFWLILYECFHQLRFVKRFLYEDGNKLVKFRCTRDYCKYFLSNRVINRLNRLDQQTVLSMGV